MFLCFNVEKYFPTGTIEIYTFINFLTELQFLPVGESVAVP